LHRETEESEAEPPVVSVWRGSARVDGATARLARWCSGFTEKTKKRGKEGGGARRGKRSGVGSARVWRRR
jgi:hypothetical protein